MKKRERWQKRSSIARTYANNNRIVKQKNKEMMNIIQFDTMIVLAFLWIAAIAIIVYDRIKYCKYYASQGKMVVLRMNNNYVRGILANKGINLCQCAYYNTNNYLYTIDGERVCGFTEGCTHLIEDATKHHQEVIDCGININRFVYEIEKLQKEFGVKEG
jgi:hypothetical protein